MLKGNRVGDSASLRIKRHYRLFGYGLTRFHCNRLLDSCDGKQKVSVQKTFYTHIEKSSGARPQLLWWIPGSQTDTRKRDDKPQLRVTTDFFITTKTHSRKRDDKPQHRVATDLYYNRDTLKYFNLNRCYRTSYILQSPTCYFQNMSGMNERCG